MATLLRSRITFIWLLLIGATALSWGMGHGLGIHDIRAAGAAIIFVSFVKVRFVILDFMELRRAPWLLRLLAEGWVVVVCTTLITLFLTAPHG